MKRELKLLFATIGVVFTFSILRNFLVDNYEIKVMLLALEIIFSIAALSKLYILMGFSGFDPEKERYEQSKIKKFTRIREGSSYATMSQYLFGKALDEKYITEALVEKIVTSKKLNLHRIEDSKKDLYLIQIYDETYGVDRYIKVDSYILE